MSRHIRSVLPFALLAFALLLTAGCDTGTPEEKIAKIRAQYKVELNSWSAQDPPQAESPMEESAGDEGAEAVAVAAAAAEAGAAAAAEAAEEAEEGAMDEEEMSGPQPKNVLFDLVVYFRGRKALEGITVDVTHADSAQQEKAVYQQWLDTAGMINGDTRQMDFMLEGMEVEDGDAFAVTLASGVPADLGNYAECSEPAP